MERMQPYDFNDATEPGYYTASNDIQPINAPLQDAAWYGSLIVTKSTGGSGGNPIMQLYFGIYPRKEIRCRQQWAGNWQDWVTL